MQAHLREIGVELDLAPAADFTPVDEGDFDLALFGFTGLVVPSVYSDVYRSDGFSNEGRYSNPEVDALLDQADHELDPDKRTQLIGEVDDLLWQDLPVIPLFQIPELVAYDESVQHVEYNGYQGFTTRADRWVRTG
jgi:peptide/nickel transport system substrate-binding protein